MNLTTHKISDFLELLASEAPAPGGGAAVALVGAVGVSLLEMVVSLTKGRKKYIDLEPLMEELSVSAKELRQSFCDAANADAEAFELVRDAYKMESDTPCKSADKEAALQSALKKATDAPISVMELSVEAARLCEKALGRSNPNVAADLSVSIILLRAAARGSQVNVDTNLELISDKRLSELFREKSLRLLEEVNAIADSMLAR